MQQRKESSLTLAEYPVLYFKGGVSIRTPPDGISWWPALVLSLLAFREHQIE